MPDETEAAAATSPTACATLAEQLTADAATPYDKAVALEQLLPERPASPTTRPSTTRARRTRSSSSCSRSAAASASSSRPRSPRWPARSVCRRASRSATRRAKPDADGVCHVKGSDAHAWPEVWLGARSAGIAFEPTQGRSDPMTGRGGPPADGSTTPSTGTTPTTVATGADDAARLDDHRAQPRQRARRPDRRRRRHRPRPAAASLDRDRRRARGPVRRRARRCSRCSRSSAHATDAQAPSRDPTRAGACSARGPRRSTGSRAAGVDAAPVGDVDRVRAAARARARRRRRGPAADGAWRACTPPRCSRPSRRPTADADAAWAHVDAIDAALRETVPRSERWLTRLRLRRRDRQRRPASATERRVDDGQRRVRHEAVDERGALGLERADLGVDVGRRPGRPRRTARADRARSASRIWPSSWHAHTLRPSVTRRRLARSSSRRRATRRTAARTRVDGSPASSSDRTTRSATRSRNA